MDVQDLLYDNCSRHQIENVLKCLNRAPVDILTFKSRCHGPSPFSLAGFVPMSVCRSVRVNGKMTIHNVCSLCVRE